MSAVDLSEDDVTEIIRTIQWFEQNAKTAASHLASLGFADEAERLNQKQRQLTRLRGLFASADRVVIFPDKDP